MEREIVEVEHNGEIIELDVPKGMSDADIKTKFKEKMAQESAPTAPSAPKPTESTGIETFLSSAVNAAGFGLPEYLDTLTRPERKQVYERARETDPQAASMGEVAGLFAPGLGGAKLLGKAATAGTDFLRGVTKAKSEVSKAVTDYSKINLANVPEEVAKQMNPKQLGQQIDNIISQIKNQLPNMNKSEQVVAWKEILELEKQREKLISAVSKIGTGITKVAAPILGLAGGGAAGGAGLAASRDQPVLPGAVSGMGMTYAPIQWLKSFLPGITP